MNFIGQFEFISWHGRLLQAKTDGEMHASQDVDKVGEEERWNVYTWNDGKISFQNYRTNRWLCAEPSGKAICNRDQPSEWEQWTLFSIGNGRVAFLNHHGKWLCAQAPGNNSKYAGEVIADRTNRAEWESFLMVPSAGIPIRNESWWNDVNSTLQIAGKVVPILIGG